MPGSSLALVSILSGIHLLGCERLIGAEFGEATLRQTCEPLALPSAPAGPDSSAAVEPLVFVVSSLDLGDEEDEAGTLRLESMGFDFDESCARPGEPPPCAAPAWTGGRSTDGPNGQDNGLGRLLYSNYTDVGTAAFTSAVLDEAVKTGAAAPNAIFRVSGYQGYNDDPAVEVEVFVGMAPARLDPPGEPPRLDGSDVLPLVRDYVDSGPAAYASRYRSTTAFVQAFTLVARFGKIRLSLNNVLVEAESAVLTAHLDSLGPGGSYRMTDGALAGIVSIQAMLDTVAETAAQSFSAASSFCTNNPLYPGVKLRECGAADLRLDGGAPDLGPGVCNALGFGYRFETVPAVLGDLVEDLRENPCPEFDPSEDSCATP